MAPPATKRWCLGLILLLLSLFFQSSTAIYCGAEDCYALLGLVYLSIPIFPFRLLFFLPFVLLIFCNFRFQCRSRCERVGYQEILLQAFSETVRKFWILLDIVGFIFVQIDWICSSLSSFSNRVLTLMNLLVIQIRIQILNRRSFLWKSPLLTRYLFVWFEILNLS